MVQLHSIMSLVAAVPMFNTVQTHSPSDNVCDSWKLHTIGSETVITVRASRWDGTSGVSRERRRPCCVALAAALQRSIKLEVIQAGTAGEQLMHR